MKPTASLGLKSALLSLLLLALLVGVWQLATRQATSVVAPSGGAKWP